MSKKILVIQAHPNNESFSAALADSYGQGAEAAGAEVRYLNLTDMDFDPILRKGYQEIQELEPDLVKAQEYIIWANHLVFTYPIWWATIPALLKGFIDRTILPGFAFQQSQKNEFPGKLLKGRSAHLIVTMDSPPWYFRFFTKRPGHNMMKKGTLQFCGVKPVRITEFAPIKTSTPEQRQKWLESIKEKGKKLV
ncbi:MAG: NAD(P)H-dependent oxidoreductase [bacterium]|nr:NAD(P)H-dependent oxidoreductase [bacterium]